MAACFMADRVSFVRFFPVTFGFSSFSCYLCMSKGSTQVFPFF
ncbi:hypothetical protein HMPREF6485_0792 [Segatella buccae ATCC 33574]|uniref:Uncharacterized protein n=1 Tax=Segatella buccae ATCC 33574 TaxID=873513 RepID=E6K5F0_9BACT|nr:hypothetical protein HMPREF6485_0792 [Segatella buccae ATCC 33574]